MTDTRLCALDDIADGEAKGLVARIDGKSRNIFAVRQGDAVYAYVNRCPHAQNLLDHPPGAFFNEDKSLLRCALHGALFRIDDGFCVEGPCEGDSLEPVAVAVRDGEIHLADEPKE